MSHSTRRMMIAFAMGAMVVGQATHVPNEGACTVAKELDDTDPVQLSLLQKDISMRKAMPMELLPASTKNSSLVSLPPIGFIKTHKTAGSSVVGMLFMMMYRRGSLVMCNNGHDLGYPYEFPGEVSTAMYGAPQHQFDLIPHHARFNSELFHDYLRPNPIFLTILREPISREKSAFNFHEVQNLPELMAGNLSNVEEFVAEHAWTLWEEHLNHLEKIKADGRIPVGDDLANIPRWKSQDDEFMFFARHYNNQAFDLGWYDYAGWTLEHDNNETMIKQWLATLDRDLGPSGSVMLMEKFDESLVLLRERLRVDAKEMVYEFENAGQFHTEPSPDQLERVRAILSVDRILYDHFEQAFWKNWEQGDPQDRQQDLAAVKGEVAKHEQTCEAGDDASEICCTDPENAYRGKCWQCRDGLGEVFPGVVALVTRLMPMD